MPNILVYDSLCSILVLTYPLKYASFLTIVTQVWGGRFSYQILNWRTNYVHVWVLEECEGRIAFDFYSLSGYIWRKHTISENLHLKWLTNGCSFGTPEVRILFLPVRFVRSECELPERVITKSHFNLFYWLQINNEPDCLFLCVFEGLWNLNLSVFTYIHVLLDLFNPDLTSVI